ncbi:MAG: ABC transporter permease [Rhodospirillaceae bacterium]|nr:ABC transporter permease [Rhodospirillaceae bacterium]
MTEHIKKVIGAPGVSALIIFIGILVGFHLYTGIFLTERNIELVLSIAPELGIVVLGVVILMIAREFDLSVGSVFALAPMVMHVLYTSGGLPPWLAIILAVAVAGGVGWINGLVTVYRQIPSFIVTLGMLFIVRSLVVVLVGPRPPVPDNIPFDVFVYDFGIIRASLLWYLGLALVIGIVLHRTNVGNWVYATGGHTQAARDMGISWRRVKMGCFMVCSMLAGFAGILQTFRVGGSVLPTYGVGLELEAIAAAVIGGTSLFGGVGSVLGALVGALLVRSIDNGFIMARVDIEFFRLALGGLTITAVMFNTDLQRWASSLKVKEVSRDE